MKTYIIRMRACIRNRIQYLSPIGDHMKFSSNYPVKKIGQTGECRHKEGGIIFPFCLLPAA